MVWHVESEKQSSELKLCKKRTITNAQYIFKNYSITDLLTYPLYNLTYQPITVSRIENFLKQNVLKYNKW
jgi:hypothetical protein